MEIIKRMARLCRNNPVPIILVSAIIVLLALNFIFIGGKGSGAGDRNISYFREMIEGTHSQIGEILSDASAMKPKELSADMNAEEQSRIILLNELQESLKNDVSWLSEKENSIYLQSQGVKEKGEMIALANSETALLIAAMQVIMLNSGAIKTAVEFYGDSESVIEEAHAASDEIEVGNFSVGEEFAALLQDTALDRAEIEAGVAELMGEYLGLRKAMLENPGETGGADAGEIEFVEALKLLSLQYFMEAGPGE
ncbi:MAG: hypothetical protein HYW05_03570 [Candidatus Diapherotrites archaeon]|nr:hypothetical protein [Candidatus Diapherotrites archaeon]